MGLPFATPRGAPFNTGGELEPAVAFTNGQNEYGNWTNGPNNARRPHRYNQLRSATARLSLDLGNDVELVSVTRHGEFERTEANDRDGIALLDSSNIKITDIESFLQKIRLSRTGERVNWIVGATLPRMML